MKKIIPFVVIGIAAASFSVLAQTSRHPDEGRGVDTGGAHPDSSAAQGTLPYQETAPQKREARSKRDRYSGDAPLQHPRDGRSVDTGGGHPDSSVAEGEMNYGSVAPRRGDPRTARDRYRGEAAAGGTRHPDEGRGVDTGGAHPDSSQAEGRLPYPSSAPERKPR